MKKILLLSMGMALPLMAMAEAPPVPKADFLTGDTKLACEAVLCLSTGSRPSECSPSIKKYFSINHKKLSDTIKGRRNFLNMCPASKDEGMPSLINALANGSGRCDANSLNQLNRYTVTVREKQKVGNRWDDYIWVTKQEIRYRNNMPSYCKTLKAHVWVDGAVNTKYVGTPDKGGRWVDGK